MELRDLSAQLANAESLVAKFLCEEFVANRLDNQAFDQLRNELAKAVRVMKKQMSVIAERDKKRRA